VRRTLLWLWIASGLVWCLAGCVVDVTPRPLDSRPPAPLTSEIAARFEYAIVHSATITEGWEDADADVLEGVMTVRVEGDDEDTYVPFEYWRSRVAADPAPAVVITPILGGGREIVLSQCRILAAAGYHVVLAKRGGRIMRRTWAIEDVETFLRRGIAARRAIVDWLETRPEVDAGRLGAYGISMGGILTSVLIAVEPRLRAAVIALAGGDLPTVIRTSTEGRLVAFREHKYETLGIDPGELEERLRQALVSDPLFLAPYVDPKQVLQITARYDQVVPPAQQQLLWEALGRPTRVDLPTGHYLGVLYLPWVMDTSLSWLRARLAAPPAVSPGPGPAVERAP
jgi:dienelactone hydrolase